MSGSGFYWKLLVRSVIRSGPAYMPADMALEQLQKYSRYGAQLRYVSGPSDSDPTGYELFIPLSLQPEQRRKLLLGLSHPMQWERVHLFDPEPRGRQENLSACEQPVPVPGRQRPRA
jgi:hypothetical protein